jgi:hypothetical protein
MEKIFETAKVILKAVCSNQKFGGRVLIRSGIKRQIGIPAGKPFLRLDLFEKDDFRKEIREAVKDIFDTDTKDISEVEDTRKVSFKSSNPVINNTESMRIVIFSDNVEVGYYTGQTYDYEVFREK